MSVERERAIYIIQTEKYKYTFNTFLKPGYLAELKQGTYFTLPKYWFG
jgi:hypothetical protein